MAGWFCRDFNSLTNHGDIEILLNHVLAVYQTPTIVILVARLVLQQDRLFTQEIQNFTRESVGATCLKNMLGVATPFEHYKSFGVGCQLERLHHR